MLKTPNNTVLGHTELLGHLFNLTTQVGLDRNRVT